MADATLRDSQGPVPGATQYDSLGRVVPGPGHNGIKNAKEYVDRIERLLADLASEKGAYMRKAKTIREDIALVLDDAKTAGIPKKELKAVIKARDLERRAASIRDDLEADAQETFDQIRLALGDLADTPLGGAVLDRATG